MKRVVSNITEEVGFNQKWKDTSCQLKLINNTDVFQLISDRCCRYDMRNWNGEENMLYYTLEKVLIPKTTFINIITCSYLINEFFSLIQRHERFTSTYRDWNSRKTTPLQLRRVITIKSVLRRTSSFRHLLA